MFECLLARFWQVISNRTTVITRYAHIVIQEVICTRYLPTGYKHFCAGLSLVQIRCT